MLIISWKQAKQKNLKRYYTGKPCPHGHICERYVNNFGCSECQKQKCKTWEINNKKHRQEYRKKYYYQNKEYFKEKGKLYREYNKEAVKECYRKWSKLNPRYKSNPEYYKEYQKNYQKNNPVGQLRFLCGKVAERLSIGKLSKNKRQLLGYTPEQLINSLIQNTIFNTLREAYDANYEVDHIVPISYIAKNI